jgi:PAS domain S-box-containing protein
MRKETPEYFEEANEGSAPKPWRRIGRWRRALAELFRRGDEERWGAQLLRISSDIMIVCGDDLAILHHNRAFLKAVGYGEGCFRGTSLTDFFPSREREGVLEAFSEWRLGHAAGMRFQAPLLTTKGERPVDFRAVRSRDRGGAFVYYLVARELPTKAKASGPEVEGEPDAFLRGLPVAAWRTDSTLRIVRAYGSLWPELGTASEDLVGEVFGRRHDSLLPKVLREIDCSDTLSGMSLQTEVRHEGEVFQVMVEPFLDATSHLVGTVGFLRRAAGLEQGSAADRLGSAGALGGRGGRHHEPPSLGVSVVTGRVPKFAPDREEAG